MEVPVLKKVISLLLVFVMVITLSSCAGTDKSIKWEIKDGTLTVNAKKNIGDFHNEFSPFLRDCYKEDLIPWYGQSFHTVVIEKKVKNIGNHSFTNSKDLEKVIINGKNVTVPECAFCYCENLKEIENMDKIIDIDRYAFYGCSSLTSISFGDKIESIGLGAFEECTNLKEVYFSESVNDICYDAFAGCTSLEEFVVDEENPYITSLDGIIYSKDMKKLLMYPPGKKDQSFVVPKQVEIIVENSFYDNDYIKNISFGSNNVTTIGESAFCSCNELEIITVPDSVTSIGEHAFSNTDNLTIICSDDSEAYTYAKNEGINIKRPAS